MSFPAYELIIHCPCQPSDHLEFRFVQQHVPHKPSLVLQVWRLRAYKPEKTLGAAKPLWFLAHELKLEKGRVQRII